MFIGVLIMMLVGFGYLMTFMKWYGLGAVGFVLLVTAMCIQWDLFTQSLFKQLVERHSDPDNYHWHWVWINIYSLLDTLYASSAVLISFGAVIGKITPFQLVLMTIIEIPLHSINYEVLMNCVMGIADVGGTYSDHMFGAYFGLAVAWVLGKPKTEPEFGTVPDVFSLIGTIFLWIYWPSFVIGAAPADSDQQARGMVNTIIALASSTVCTFWATLVWSKQKKFRPVDIQNATLAGGVAIGCTANLTMSAFGACMIGCTAGLVSCFGYNFIQPFLEERLNLHDTCGIHNLHAMPSVVGGLASVILAGYKTYNGLEHDSAIYGLTYASQWWRQWVAILLCIGFAVTNGIITGYLLRYLEPTDRLGKSSGETDEFSEKQFHDEQWWAVAGDYDISIYSQLALLINDDKDGITQIFKDALVNQALADQSMHEGRRKAPVKKDGLDWSSHHANRSQHSLHNAPSISIPTSDSIAKNV